MRDYIIGFLLGLLWVIADRLEMAKVYNLIEKLNTRVIQLETRIYRKD